MQEQPRKGIILAGGSGTRLAPLTDIISKQLLPIYDKPMLYYPLSLLMLAGIREVLIIGEMEGLPLLKRLLGDGSRIGMQIGYEVQTAPRGLADAFIVAADFLAGSSSCLVLGDNFLYGHQLTAILRTAAAREMPTVFGVYVRNPQDYGVLTLDAAGRPTSVEEKPRQPRSNIAVPGVYFFDAQAPSIAREVTPSPRGEMEITSIIARYIALQRLEVEILGRGFAWFDAGTHDALLEASNFVETIERRQAQKIGCIEEIAYNQGWVSSHQLRSLAARYGKSGYGDYLMTVLDPPAGLDPNVPAPGP